MRCILSLLQGYVHGFETFALSYYELVIVVAKLDQNHAPNLLMKTYSAIIEGLKLCIHILRMNAAARGYRPELSPRVSNHNGLGI